jgi:hypothetical protein
MKVLLSIVAFLTLSQAALAQDCRPTAEAFAQAYYGSPKTAFHLDKKNQTALYGDSAFGKVAYAIEKPIPTQDWNDLEKLKKKNSANSPVEIRAAGKNTEIVRLKFKSVAQEFDPKLTEVTRLNSTIVTLDEDCEIMSISYAWPQQITVSSYDCARIRDTDAKDIKDLRKDMKKLRDRVLRRFDRARSRVQMTEAMADVIGVDCSGKFGPKNVALSKFLPKNIIKHAETPGSRSSGTAIRASQNEFN